jgi:uncharacterized Tic20 family protein
MSDATPPPGNPYQSANVQMNPADEKLWATLIHIGGIFFNFLPALIGYLILKDRGPFVRQHTATALNFQLTVLIAYIISYILMIVFIGFILWLAVWAVNIIFSIIAAIAANKGQGYTYPMSIPFVK